MRWFGWFRPQPVAQPIPESPVTPQNLAQVLEVLLVKRIEAEANLEGAKVETELRRMRERDELRQVRRERALKNNATLPRNSKGKLMKRQSEPELCVICQGARTFTDDQLAAHRAHPVTLVS